MSLTADGRIPLYLQLYWKIKNDILMEDFLPGGRLPTVVELHKRYAISPGTVRKALELLEAENLIILKPGLGTFVRDDIDLVNQAYPLDPQARLNNLKTNFNLKWLSDEWIAPPNRIATIFDSYQDSYQENRIFKIRLVFAKIDNPGQKIYMEAFLSAWFVKAVPLEQIRDKKLLDLIMTSKDFHAVRLEHLIRPWITDHDTALLLGLPTGTPVLHWSWIHYAQNARPVICSEMLSFANVMKSIYEIAGD